MEKKTSDNLKKHLNDVFDKYHVDKGNINITTDCGSNIMKAVSGFKSFKCMCHRLSTRIEDAWKKSLTMDTDLSCLDQASNAAINRLTHAVDIQKRLPVKVKPGSSTRAWRGLSYKFANILKAYDTLCDILPERQKSSVYTELIKSFLKNCVTS